MEFDGKVAIVTGAGSGLGAVYARGLAAEGAAVTVADYDGAAAEAVAKELSEAGRSAMAFQLDVTDDAAVERMVGETVSALGGVDILVNNAGWRPNPYGALYDNLPAGAQDELDADAWRRVLDVNVVAPLVCAQACRPHMVRRGGGAIVNQSSNASFGHQDTLYGVSKLAVNGLTVWMASHYAQDGIRVNAIAPGSMTGRMPKEIADQIMRGQKIKRPGRPEDLVGALLFLCSDRSSFMTGETLKVDGGESARA